MLLPGIKALVTSTSKLPISRAFLPELLSPSFTEWNQNRGRKRNFKTGYTREQRRIKKLEREEAEKKRQQIKSKFLLAMKDSKVTSSMVKTKQSPCYALFDDEKEAQLPDKAPTNVYFIKDVKTQLMSLKEILEIYRKVTDKSVHLEVYYNTILKIFCQLDMSTEKNNKYIHDSQDLIKMPHQFSYKDRRTIMAFIKDKDLTEQAIEAGVDKVLGPDSVKKILRGVVKMDEYDFCLASTDMAANISSMRGVLGNKLPTKINGRLTDDLLGAIDTFKKGIRVTIAQDRSMLSTGTAIGAFGRMRMNDSELEENLQHIVTTICSKRNPALGPFITHARIICRGVKNMYHIDITPYLSKPTQEQIDKIEAQQKKKKDKADVAKKNKAKKLKIVPWEKKLKNLM